MENEKQRSAFQKVRRSQSLHPFFLTRTHARRRRGHTPRRDAAHHPPPPPPPCGSPPALASHSCSPAAPSPPHPPPPPPPPTSRARAQVSLASSPPTRSLGFSRFLGPGPDAPPRPAISAACLPPAGIWSDAARAAPSRASPFSSPSTAHRFFHGECCRFARLVSD